MRTLWGWILLATAFVACPCHLPLTLPLLLAVFGGSAFGAFLAGHPELVAAAAMAYFAVALLAGWALLRDRQQAERAGAEPGNVTVSASATADDCPCCTQEDVLRATETIPPAPARAPGQIAANGRVAGAEGTAPRRALPRGAAAPRATSTGERG